MTSERKNKPKIAFNMDKDKYNGLLVVAAHAGKAPGPYVRELANREGEKGLKMKGKVK